MPYANIRELLPAIGLKILHISQHDEDEWIAGHPAYFTLHFDDGSSLTVIVEDERVVVVTPPAQR